MKLYDIYLTRQAKYNEYVILIESGMFVDAYDKDATILNKLLQYKMVPGNQFIKVINWNVYDSFYTKNTSMITIYMI